MASIVTGGAGFLGSHLCERLVKMGEEVFCVDNFGSGQKSNVAHLRNDPEFELIEADIRDFPQLPEVDQIYHFASRASPKDFTSYPVQIALTNTEGTRHLLDHAVECDAKMIFASTSEVYGDPKVHPQPESYNGNVNIRGERGCYDESKRFGETLTVAYHKKHDLDVRTIRIFNTYGPRMRPDDGRVVPTFLKQALTEKDLTVYGDGSQTRTFCYVSDLIDGVIRAMKRKDLAGNVLNLGGENEISIHTLAETIIEITETSSKIVHKPLPEDDPSRRRPDISRAKKELNWEPNINFDDGIKKTLLWVKNELEQEDS